jgi:hypothetical protein
LRASTNLILQSPVYSANHFLFIDRRTLEVFLEAIGEGVKHIELISLTTWTGNVNMRLGFDKLAQASNLKALILEERFLEGMNFYRPTFRKAPGVVAGPFNHIAHAWLSMMATNLGGVEHAMDLLFFPKRFRGRYEGKDGQRFRQPYSHGKDLSGHGPSPDRMWDLGDEAVFRTEVLKAMRG